MAHDEPSPREHEDVFLAFRNAKHDPARREHLIILLALEEMIRERKQPHPSTTTALPSPNEYFAAIMTALEAKDQSHTPELVCLLEAVIGRTEKGILRSKFKSISGVLTLLLTTNLEHEMTAFVRDLVSCLGKLLLAQEVSKAAWASPRTVKTFFVLLSCFREKRPKVRKAAMLATVELLRQHARRQVWTLGNEVAEFCATVLGECTASDCVPTLHLLGFLQEALAVLPEAAVRTLAEQVLRLQSLESTMVVQASLHTLKALVKAQESVDAEPSPRLPSAFLLELSEGVLDLQPSHHDKDAEVCRAFCELVAACLECLAKRGEAAQARRQLLPRAMQALVARCETDSARVHEAACAAMRMAWAGVVDASALSSPEDRKPVMDALAAVAKLLEYRYQRAWGVCLPFLGSLFIHFKQGADGLLNPLLQKLAFLHDAVATSAPELVKPFESCIALTIEGMGIEQVLAVLPLMEEDTTPVPSAKGGGGKKAAGAAAAATRRATWLLPLLASHGKRQSGRLAYFQGTLLELARRSHEVVVAGTAPAKQLQLHRQRVLQLWALLPAFCSHPSDTSASFGALAPALANALQDASYPELLFTVCQGLQMLLQSVQEAAPGPTRDADLATLVALSKKFLPTLFNILDNCPLEDSASGVKVRALSDTISAFTLVAPKPFVASLFKKLVQKMLEATQTGDDDMGLSQSNHKAVILCELALALVPSLDAAGITLLYKVIRPLVRLDKDVALQKRAYRVLGALCQHHGEQFLGQQETLQDLVPVLTDSLLTCHVSARQMRLRVLGAVVKTLDGDNAAHWDLLAGLVGEVLLCLKDANGKAREAAYQVLSAMAQVKADEEDMAEFSQVVLAALAAETPHMRSAAVLALAHLVFEFGPQRPAFRATIPELLATVLLLGQDPVKEVIKAVVSFVRICVAACPLGSLEPMLPDVIECLFASNSKVRFRAKIKIILKKLCRKFSYERILALAPSTDRKLISHIQKQALRGDRISANAAAAAGSGVRGQPSGYDEDDEEDARRFEYLLGDEEGEDDEGSEDDGMDEDDDMDEGAAAAAAVPFSRRKLKPGEAAQMREKRLRDSQGLMVRDSSGIVDLLDSSMIQNLKLGGGRVAGAPPLGARKRFRDESDDDGSDGDAGAGYSDEDDDDEVLEFNEEGKLVVPDAALATKAGGEMPATPQTYAHMMAEDAIESDDDKDRKKGGNKRPRYEGHGGGGGGRHHRDGKKSGGPPNKNLSRKQQQKNQAAHQAPGTAYRNKKAGGDVKRQGALEPYAYIPLNAKMLSKKTAKGEAARTFGAVVDNKKKRKEEQQQRGGGQKTRKGGRR